MWEDRRESWTESGRQKQLLSMPVDGFRQLLTPRSTVVSTPRLASRGIRRFLKLSGIRWSIGSKGRLSEPGKSNLATYIVKSTAFKLHPTPARCYHHSRRRCACHL